MKYFHADDFMFYKNPKEGKPDVLENKQTKKLEREIYATEKLISIKKSTLWKGETKCCINAKLKQQQLAKTELEKIYEGISHRCNLRSMENRCCTVPGTKEAVISSYFLLLGRPQPGWGGQSRCRGAGGSAEHSWVIRNDSPPAPEPPPLQREASKHHKSSLLFVNVSFANTKCF